MVSRPKRFFVDRPAQLIALESPTAHRVVGALEHLGEASVREISGWTGLSAEALHYHVNRLTKAGVLLRETKHDPGLAREVARYTLPGREIVFDRSNRSHKFVEGMIRVARAALRATERLYCAALADDNLRHSGAHRDLALIRVHGRLGKKDIKELNRKLEEIADFITERSAAPGENDQLYAVTIVMSPEEG